MNLVFTSDAEADLRSIADYISHYSGSTHTALVFIEKIIAKCEHLASLPLTVGTPRPDLAPDIYAYTFGSYMIFYRYRADIMEVAIITEGHRQVKDLFH